MVLKMTTENSGPTSPIKNRLRKRKINEDNNESSTDGPDYFKIEDYEITDLKSLIQLIYDLINKDPPPKRLKRKLPKKLYQLIDIIEPLESLNGLVGLNKLKEQLLEQLLYFVQGNNDNIMLHTVIEGPPGTGKTTVANLMAQIYAGLGILKKNRCTVVKREDLIGQFLGETTLKTMDTLQTCKNGVMLIDEAYSLGSPDNRDSYAKEAIDCINQFLTENADKIICIIAGYKEELNMCFFSQNKGLRRRFPWTFTIEDFTKTELAQIFIDKVNNSDDYELEEEIDVKYLESKIKKECFYGNAGDIENIISRAKIINSRLNFCRENNYILSKRVINEAFDKFYDTRTKINNEPPPMMYT
jgi:SpoVK/Ycf46/Vps4 family AAA+-type ATPase